MSRFGRAVARVAVRDDGAWAVDDVVASRVVVATGGRSVPATGSTGFGLDLAARVGHDLVPAVPALAPLLGPAREDLAGLTVPVVLRVVDGADGRERRRAAGSLLFTHRGVTGPAALDVSEEVERAATNARRVRVLADLWSLADPHGPFADHLGAPKLPGCCLRTAPPAAEAGEVDRDLQAAASGDPRSSLGTVLGRRLPRRLVRAVAPRRGRPRRPAATGGPPRGRRPPGVVGPRHHRERGVREGRGHRRGVRLDELHRTTLESRQAPRLHLCGEVCDVTGRLGGFNFQWAWSSGALAGWGAGQT